MAALGRGRRLGASLEGASSRAATRLLRCGREAAIGQELGNGSGKGGGDGQEKDGTASVGRMESW